MNRHLCPLLALAAACSGQVVELPPPSPADAPGVTHRPQSVVCPTSVGPSSRDPMTGKLREGCATDADCNPDGARLSLPYGKGRCVSFKGALQCSYDQCAQDSDCAAGGVCSCQGQTRGYAGASPGNTCVMANCRTDADCADTHACSPSVGFGGGPFYGVRGYFCHTKMDRCRQDADCAQGQSCAFEPQSGVWACSDAHAAG
jgi:hypothetical protein